MNVLYLTALFTAIVWLLIWADDNWPDGPTAGADLN